jgi:hypothetical protein
VIIDSELEELLRQVGDAIDVPADGPARILALREEGAARTPSPPDETGEPKVEDDRGWGRRMLAAAAVVVVIAGVGVLLTRHGSHPKFVGIAGSLNGGPSTTVPTPSGGGGVSGFGTGSSSSGSVAPPLAVATPPQATPPPPALATKVIKLGSVSLVVPKGQLSPTVNQVEGLASGLGGYVSDAKTTEGSDAPTGDLTLRVPAAQFEALLTRVRSLGKPTSITTSGQDVTADYVDLQARISSLQATRDQFLQVLAKATQIGDILSVEQQLSSLQTQIEQLQGQQRVLDDQTTYGTLDVHLTEAGSSADAAPVGPVKGPSGWTTAWRHARHSFAHGIQSVIAASGGVAIFLLSVALLALLARYLWTVIRRRLV